MLIFVDRITNRLGYTLNLVFKDILGIDYKITTKKNEFIDFDGHKFSYTKKKISDEVFLYSTNLLFETVIQSQDLELFTYENYPAVFPTYSKESILPFDFLSASFYFVSRYEEYLPFLQDEHNRFTHKESFAYQKNFLHIPIVNIWVKKFKSKLFERYPDIVFEKKYFRFYNTIDIDSAYSFVQKGLFRNSFGFVRDLFRGNFSECVYRMNVYIKKRKDPYDTFEYQMNIINNYKLKTIYFTLFGRYGKYDKNISPYNKKFHSLIKSLCDYAKVGIHPSYASFEDINQIKKQIKDLQGVIHKPIIRNRFHYIRFRLPNSFRLLIESKILEDYSMGYSSIIGFRAGICTEYSFYDLEFDYETTLRLHPFVIMDVALKNGMRLSKEEAKQQINNMIKEVSNVEGDFISIWHNESLSDMYEWKGWKSVYENMIDMASLIDRAPFKNDRY